MASVSTPRGDDSEPDGDLVPEISEPTTLILENIPEYLTQGALVSLFEDLSPCMRATFDFFYLPWNPDQCCNLGYAIVNFYDAAGAERFRSEWNTQDLTHGCECGKR